MSIQLSELLSKQARILHTTRRSYFEKRIIEFKGEKYVLYRFPKAATANQFADILEEAHQAGASLQKVIARPSNSLLYRRWLALSFEAGEQIHGKSEDPTIFASLGKTLAILHHQASRKPGPLVHTLPALDEKLDPSLPTDAISKWLEASRERLSRLKDFRLNHGDLYAKNIIITTTNESVLIDYELFSYELPGIELSALLLLRLCRQEKKREVLLENYLVHCDPKTQQIWHQYWRDFLVAAALRIAAQRQRRKMIVLRRSNWIDWITRLPMPRGLKHHFESLKKNNESTIRNSQIKKIRNQKLAEKLVRFIISGKFNNPNELITACFYKKNKLSSIRKTHNL